MERRLFEDAQGQRTTAARASASPRRISIVGSTGSGKTHLARLLADKLDLPHFELDRISTPSPACGNQGDAFWKAADEWLRQQRWVIDGHYRQVRDRVWARAELIVYLDYSLAVIASRLLRRFLAKQFSGAPRPIARGRSDDHLVSQPQRASWARRWQRLRKTLRERREYGGVLGSRSEWGDKVIRLDTPRAAQAWLDSLTGGEANG